jgi:cell wall-associated NlpC family hydrolase
VDARASQGEVESPKPGVVHGFKLPPPPPIPEEMSIEAVVGRIDQIMAMQQQLVDPASAAGASTGGTSAASTGSAGAGASSATFSAALESALGASAIGTDSTSGTDPTAALGTDSTAATGELTSALASLSPSLATASPTLGLSTTTTGSATAQVQAMVNMANSLVGKPYVYGGGHGGWGPQAGYDCSGFVSAVLHAGGYLTQPVDTTALPQQPGMEPGPGQYVTVYDRALPGQSGHVIIEIDGQFYESGGSHGAWGGGGGVEKIGTPSADYLAQFPNVLHPAGL